MVVCEYMYVITRYFVSPTIYVLGICDTITHVERIGDTTEGTITVPKLFFQHIDCYSCLALGLYEKVFYLHDVH